MLITLDYLVTNRAITYANVEMANDSDAARKDLIAAGLLILRATGRLSSDGLLSVEDKLAGHDETVNEHDNTEPEHQLTINATHIISRFSGLSYDGVKKVGLLQHELQEILQPILAVYQNELDSRHCVVPAKLVAADQIEAFKLFIDGYKDDEIMQKLGITDLSRNSLAAYRQRFYKYVKENIPHSLIRKSMGYIVGPHTLKYQSNTPLHEVNTYGDVLPGGGKATGRQLDLINILNLSSNLPEQMQVAEAGIIIIDFLDTTQAYTKLKPKTKDMLKEYFSSKKTKHEIATKYDITPNRVVSCVSQLRTALRKELHSER